MIHIEFSIFGNQKGTRAKKREKLFYEISQHRIMHAPAKERMGYFKWKENKNVKNNIGGFINTSSSTKHYDWRIFFTFPSCSFQSECFYAVASVQLLVAIGAAGAGGRCWLYVISLSSTLFLLICLCRTHLSRAPFIRPSIHPFRPHCSFLTWKWAVMILIHTEICTSNAGTKKLMWEDLTTKDPWFALFLSGQHNNTQHMLH